MAQALKGRAHQQVLKLPKLVVPHHHNKQANCDKEIALYDLMPWNRAYSSRCVSRSGQPHHWGDFCSARHDERRPPVKF